MKKLFYSVVGVLVVADLAIFIYRHKTKTIKAVDPAQAQVQGAPAKKPVLLGAASKSGVQAARGESSEKNSVSLPSATAIGQTGAGWVQFMNHLKTCTPFVLNYKSLEWEQGARQKIIQGKNGDSCLVIDVLPDRKLNCELSPEAVAEMTSEERYKDIEEGPFSQSPDELTSTENPHCQQARL